MDILTKPLSSFTFEDIQSFAQELKPEGYQLDYKKDFQIDEKTSELVAAFANSRGGVIILGVGENRTTGIPISWEGIDDGRHEERVAQIMSNIHPIPTFEVHKTNSYEGKVFVLIRIFEGTETPYYPHNDSNLWVRTGSIKKAVDIASPEMAELLFKKAEKAELARIVNQKIAELNYNNFKTFGERERQKEANDERLSGVPVSQRLVQQEQIGENTSMLTILIQPYFPHQDFVKPQQTEEIIQTSREENAIYSFPILSEWNSIPNGMINFDWRGELICQQIFSNGLIYSSHNILRLNKDVRATHIAWLTGELYITLKGGKNVWEKLGYQGTLVGHMTVKGLNNVIVQPIVGGRIIGTNNRESVFTEYTWQLKIDTNTLANQDKLCDYVTEVTKDIHWSFGYKNYQEVITKEYLKQQRYL